MHLELMPENIKDVAHFTTSYLEGRIQDANNAVVAVDLFYFLDKINHLVNKAPFYRQYVD